MLDISLDILIICKVFGRMYHGDPDQSVQMGFFGIFISGR